MSVRSTVLPACTAIQVQASVQCSALGVHVQILLSIIRWLPFFEQPSCHLFRFPLLNLRVHCPENRQCCSIQLRKALQRTELQTSLVTEPSLPSERSLAVRKNSNYSVRFSSCWPEISLFPDCVLKRQFSFQTCTALAAFPAKRTLLGLLQLYCRPTCVEVVDPDCFMR